MIIACTASGIRMKKNNYIFFGPTGNGIFTMAGNFV